MPATYEPIATTTVAGSAATEINFNSIPSTYTDLVVIVYGNGTRNLYGGDLNFQFNGDTTNIYGTTILRANASGTAAIYYSSETASNMGVLGANGTNFFTTNYILIKSYRDTSCFKHYLSYFGDGNPSGNNTANYTGGQWRSTSAITSIKITGNGYNFNIGTMATLYGILKA
jgi:hypothetical protein